MVKRYFCDYCGKSFQDNPSSRRRHMKGVSHQRNRRMHYDSVMAEQLTQRSTLRHSGFLYTSSSGKDILQQWLSLHPEVVKRLREQKTQPIDSKRREQTANSKDTATANGEADGEQFSLPPELEPYRTSLPPSLLPPMARALHFPGYTSTGPADWG